MKNNPSQEHPDVMGGGKEDGRISCRLLKLLLGSIIHFFHISLAKRMICPRLLSRSQEIDSSLRKGPGVSCSDGLHNNIVDPRSLICSLEWSNCPFFPE